MRVENLVKLCLFIFFREKLKEIPDKIHENVTKKNFLVAAQLVVQAQENLQGALQKIEGLKDVRTDLALKQEVISIFAKYQFVLNCLNFCISIALLYNSFGRSKPFYLCQIIE